MTVACVLVGLGIIYLITSICLNLRENKEGRWLVRAGLMRGREEDD